MNALFVLRLLVRQFVFFYLFDNVLLKSQRVSARCPFSLDCILLVPSGKYKVSTLIRTGQRKKKEPGLLRALFKTVAEIFHQLGNVFTNGGILYSAYGPLPITHQYSPPAAHWSR